MAIRSPRPQARNTPPHFRHFAQFHRKKLSNLPKCNNFNSDAAKVVGFDDMDSTITAHYEALVK